MERDALLLRRVKNGDEDAIEEFVRKFYPIILRYCCLHAPERETAEDITQETFARFFRTLPQYRHYGKAANYLYVIAGNLCRDCYRHPAEYPLEGTEDSPSGGMDTADARLDVRRALAALPPELREISILCFYQELKQKEIAAVLGIGLPLVKYRIRRAKELLQKMLAEEDYI